MHHHPQAGDKGFPVEQLQAIEQFDLQASHAAALRLGNRVRQRLRGLLCADCPDFFAVRLCCCGALLFCFGA